MWLQPPPWDGNLCLPSYGSGGEYWTIGLTQESRPEDLSIEHRICLNVLSLQCSEFKIKPEFIMYILEEKEGFVKQHM